MTISELFDFSIRYLILGIAIGVLFLAGAVFYVKKREKKGRPVSKSGLFLRMLFVVYFVVLMCATLARDGYGRIMKMQPFSSYMAAWNSAAASEWRNLVINILLFVPLGFFLPFLSARFRKCWKTYAAGFLTSVLIECVQFSLCRGVVEFDDVINNTLGTMIGYGIGRLAVHGWCRKKNESREKWGVIALYQIPLVTVVSAYILLFCIYIQMPMGTLSCAYSETIDMSHIKVTSQCEMDSQGKKDYVYTGRMWSEEECRAFAESYFRNLGTEMAETETDIYENTVYYRPKTLQYILMLAYRGGTYELTDFGSEDETEEMFLADGESGLTSDEVKELLQAYYITIPESAAFSETNDGEYRFAVEPVREGESWVYGECIATRILNGRIHSIRNNISSFSERREVKIRSVQSAYECLERGEFVSSDVRMDISNVSEIQVSHVAISYEIDSKGYAQPVYKFYVTLNQDEEETAEIKIPAMEKMF